MTAQERLDDPRLRHLSRTERRVTAYFCEQLEHALPGRVERLILFGSKAEKSVKVIEDLLAKEVDGCSAN